MDKKKWIADKIEKLIAEGKEPDQASETAHSMWEDKYEKKDTDGIKSMQLTQSEVGYVPVSVEPGRMCAGCRWFETYGDQWSAHARCHLIEAYPAAIEPTGYCERYEALPVAQPYAMTPMPVVIVEAVEEAETEAGKFFETDSALVTLTVTADDAKSVDAIPDGATVVLFADEHKAADDPCIEKHLEKLVAGGMIHADALKKAEALCAEEKPRKSLTAQVREALGSLLARKDTLENGIKVHGNHFLVTWSNDFEDREGEIFTRKAIDDYVDRTDGGVIPVPLIWVWHTGERTQIGATALVARHEHFLVAAGEFDNTPAAQKAKAYYAKNQKKTSVSHGFTYPRDQFDGKHYHQFNTFEISLLPRGVEANRYTTLEGVKAMAVSEEKKRYIEDVFGKETAEQIFSDLTERGKALEELGAKFKDFVVVNPNETPASKEAVENVERDLKQLFVETLGDSAEVVRIASAMSKAVDAHKAEVAGLIAAQQKTITDQTTQLAAFAERLGDRSRSASKAAETEIGKTDERFKTMEEAIRQQTTVKHPFFGTEVNSLDTEGQNGR